MTLWITTNWPILSFSVLMVFSAGLLVQQIRSHSKRLDAKVSEDVCGERHMHVESLCRESMATNEARMTRVEYSIEGHMKTMTEAMKTLATDIKLDVNRLEDHLLNHIQQNGKTK